MKGKTKLIIEIVIVVGFVFYYIWKILIPDLQNTLGSSDRLLNSSRYDNMVELIIDNQVDVGFLIDSKGTIYHLLFFDKNAASLYNQNIENHTIEEVFNQSIEILMRKGFIENESVVRIVFYDSTWKDEVMSTLRYDFSKYSLNPNIQEESNTLIQRVFELGESTTKNSEALQLLDYYSKNITRGYHSMEVTPLSSKDASLMADNVYRKIEEYVQSSSYDFDLIIQTIPADSLSIYYPSNQSWYSIQDGKVYAYIEFTGTGEVFGYCYQGSIDAKAEGECLVS